MLAQEIGADMRLSCSQISLRSLLRLWFALHFAFQWVDVCYQHGAWIDAWIINFPA